MANFTTTLKRALAGAAAADRMVGTFVSTDGVRAVVDVGGGRIPADLAGYTPQVNESVWVLFLNGTATILGPTVQRPGIGTVTGAPSGNLVPVNTTAGAFTLPYASGLSLSSGQVVRLGAANDGMFVYAVMSTSPPPDTAPPAPGGGGGDHTVIFTALDAGSYNTSQGKWLTAQVWASNSNISGWFYGSKIADTIPDGATIVSIEIWISISSLYVNGPVFGYHSNGSKPGGAPSLSGLTSRSISDRTWLGLPTAFGDYLKSHVGGVGIQHGGYSILNALSADPQSGALRIHWRS